MSARQWGTPSKALRESPFLAFSTFWRFLSFLDCGHITPTPASIYLHIVISSMYVRSYRTFVMAFRAHLDNARYSSHLEMLNLITSTETLLLLLSLAIQGNINKFQELRHGYLFGDHFFRSLSQAYLLPIQLGLFPSPSFLTFTHVPAPALTMTSNFFQL